MGDGFMLQETKRDLTMCARNLAKPYEKYSIDELADAYCDAVDSNNETLKSVYISALILRFWYTIDKMYRANKVAPSLEHEDFFWWLYEAIEYACKYRGWRDPSKKLNAQQCINKCIETIKLQKYYTLRYAKNQTANHCISIDTPLKESSDGKVMTIADTLEAEDYFEDCFAAEDTIRLIQTYVDRNKIIEAVLLDNIAFNDVQKYHKRVVKTQTFDGQLLKYVEHSSEFWPYKLIQTVNKLPDTYKDTFMKRYRISETKLAAALTAIDKAPNTKLYNYLRTTLAELRKNYVGCAV
jgi:hypothetical protein